MAAAHCRESWGHPGDGKVIVHSRLDHMKGTAYHDGRRAQYGAQYALAKRQGDMKAAVDLVQRCACEAALDAIADAVLGANSEPIIAFPHPSFDDEEADGPRSVENVRPPNAIPFALANFLAETLGGSVNDSIIESARPGRSKLKEFPRFLWQPRFEGEVERRRPYILVDDVVTTGGTLAALRSHVVRGGGTIIAVTALAHAEGADQIFAITPETLSQLDLVYGKEIATFWLETIGHVPHCLSDHEGQFLVRWGRQEAGRSARTGVERLYALRTRIAAAAAKGE